MEPFQGRYRLVERLGDCGGLPRHRVAAVTLEGPVEAIQVSGVRRWRGLPELVWLRLARRAERFASASHAPLAVEQDGDSLLILHPPLPPQSLEDSLPQLSPARLRPELASLLSWAARSTRAGPGCGNLRLSTIWRAGRSFAVAPTACALPPSLIAGHGGWRRWRTLLARGEAGEAALDLSLLCHDLTRCLAQVPWLGRLGRPVSAEQNLRQASAALADLRAAMTACIRAAQAGASPLELTERLEAAAAGLRGGAAGPQAGPPRRSGPVEPDWPVRASGAAVDRLKVHPASGTFEIPAGLLDVAAVRDLVISRLPAQADLTLARGLAAEALTPPPGSGRPAGESWLILDCGGGQPPVAAARWLARTRGRRRKIVLCAAAEPSLTERLLRRDLELRWSCPVIACAPALSPGPSAGSTAAPIAGRPAGPARSPLLAEYDAGVVLALLAFSDVALPLTLLGEASDVSPGRLGALLGTMQAAGWVAVETIQAGWLRADQACSARVTPLGRAALAELATAPMARGPFLALILHHLPASRRSDLLWLRSYLLMVSDDRRAAAHELGALIDSTAPQDEDYLGIAACAESLAPAMTGALSNTLRLRAGCRLGQACQSRGMFDEALALYESGLELWRSSPAAASSASDAEAGAAVVVALADLLDNRGEFVKVLALLREILGPDGSDLPATVRDKLRFSLAWAHFQVGEHEQALEICHALLKQLDAETFPAETAEVYNLIGMLRYNSSRYEEARVNLQKGLVLRERVNDLAAVARSCNNLGLAHMGLGDLVRADAFLQRSLAIKNAAGDRPGVASCLINLAYIALAQEQHDLSRERADQALAIARDLGLRQHTAECLQLQGEVSEGQERLDEAGRFYEEAHDLALEIGDEDQVMAALRGRAGLLLQAGDLAGARSRLGAAKALLPHVPSLLQRALLSELEGILLTAEGDHAAAAAAFEQAVTGLSELHKPDLEIRGRARAALAWHRTGDSARARALFESVRAWEADPRWGRLPPELAELERIFGPPSWLAPAGDGASEALLRCLVALPELETRRLGFSAYVRRVLDLLHGAGVFAQVAFTIVTPTGETTGRWQAPPTTQGSGGPARASSDPPPQRITVRHLWPDGSAVVGDATLPSPGAEAQERDASRLRDRVEGALALVAGAIGSYRLRTVEESRKRRAGAPERAVAGGFSAESPVSVPLVGVSEPLAELRRVIDKVADLDTHVLIFGENGSGKDVVARLIHLRSQRRNEGFVAVNCASIPAALLESQLFGHERGAFTDAVARRIGDFERAGRGTILLDEIGEMPLPLQPKLLRVLQEKEFIRVGGGDPVRLRARVLAATNMDIERAIADGRFRQDLYYRLAVISVPVPPLRKRPEDIPVLLRHFLEKYAAEFGVPVCQLSPEALDALCAAPWPGNVRELENLAKRLLIFAEGGTVQRRDLPPSLAGGQAAAPGGERLEDLVARFVQATDFDDQQPLLPRLRELLARQLVARFENKAMVARVLGITPPTLYEWLRRGGEVAPGDAKTKREKAGA